VLDLSVVKYEAEWGCKKKSFGGGFGDGCMFSEFEGVAMCNSAG